MIVLADGSEIPARTVIIASGARYQRLAVDDLERFEGAGVYYAATDLEARICAGQPVIVVGGGNSAGQAAIYLAQQGSQVSIVIRGDDLTHSMSHYLIERIEADPRIEFFTTTEVRALVGRRTSRAGHPRAHPVRGAPDRRLLRPVLLHRRGSRHRVVGWCAGARREGLHPHGPRVAGSNRRTVHSSRMRDPLPFETSVPGVFAVGDVRSGSLKRVAAAVGEGSSAVRSVHDHLAAIT